jgi:hypothetical protein
MWYSPWHVVIVLVAAVVEVAPQLYSLAHIPWLRSTMRESNHNASSGASLSNVFRFFFLYAQNEKKERKEKQRKKERKSKERKKGRKLTWSRKRYRIKRLMMSGFSHHQHSHPRLDSNSAPRQLTTLGLSKLSSFTPLRPHRPK